MTTQPTTTKEALEPCPFSSLSGKHVLETKQDANRWMPFQWVVICWCGATGPQRSSEADAIITWNSRVSAPIVAPEVDESWFDLALRYLRGDPALTDVPYSDDSVFADFLRFWDAQTPHFRSVIGSVFRAAPKFTAPASTVAPQQSVPARCHCNVFCEFEDSPTKPENCVNVTASPVALRDEAVCKCGLDKDDPIHSFSTERQQMHSFTPKDATTPPSTRAKAAAEEIQDWNECGETQGSHDADVAFIQAIIERCLAGGSE